MRGSLDRWVDKVMERLAEEMEALDADGLDLFGEAEDLDAFGPPLEGFGLDQHGLTPALRSSVDQVAREIVAAVRSGRAVTGVRLIGHTDPSGPAFYNQALGLRRATGVRDRLRATLRALAPDLAARLPLEVASAGANVPVAPNTTADGRRRNRRVEVTLIEAPPPPPPPRPPPPPQRPPPPMRPMPELRPGGPPPTTGFCGELACRTRTFLARHGGPRAAPGMPEAVIRRAIDIEQQEAVSMGPPPGRIGDPEDYRLWVQSQRAPARERVLTFLGLRGMIPGPLAR